MILEIVCFVFIVLIVGLICFCLYFGAKAGRRIRAMEFLFSDTLEEMESAYEIFSKLTSRSTMLTDHPDIKSLEQVMLLILDILERYLKDGKQITSSEAEQKKGEK